MHWIYLSPHLDDVVLSVGGLVWEQAQAGENPAIWSICAGDPPPPPYTPFAEELHERWQVGPGELSQAGRRAEDADSCRALGVPYRHSDVPDCIYRRLPDGQPTIDVRDSLFRPFPAGEAYLVRQIAAWIAQELPADARLVSPLCLGGHIDHWLVRAAAESLGKPVWYYADYPYVIDDPLEHHDLRPSLRGLPIALRQPLSGAALAAWQAGIAAHRSQISTFWGSLAEMQAKISQYYAEGGGGSILWSHDSHKST